MMVVETVSCVQGGGVDAQHIAKVIRLSRQRAQLQDDYNIPCVSCMWHDHSKLISQFTFEKKSNVHWNEILVTHASRGSNIYRI